MIDNDLEFLAGGVEVANNCLAANGCDDEGDEDDDGNDDVGEAGAEADFTGVFCFTFNLGGDFTFNGDLFTVLPGVLDLVFVFLDTVVVGPLPGVVFLVVLDFTFFGEFEFFFLEGVVEDDVEAAVADFSSLVFSFLFPFSG